MAAVKSLWFTCEDPAGLEVSVVRSNSYSTCTVPKGIGVLKRCIEFPALIVHFSPTLRRMVEMYSYRANQSVIAVVYQSRVTDLASYTARFVTLCNTGSYNNATPISVIGVPLKA